MDDESDIEIIDPRSSTHSRMTTSRNQHVPWDIHRVSVVPSPLLNKDEYEWDERLERVEKVLREVEDVDEVQYVVRFGDAHTETVSGIAPTHCYRPPCDHVNAPSNHSEASLFFSLHSNSLPTTSFLI